MTMVKFTYDDGENRVEVAWTPEYGIIEAGPRALLDRINVEVIVPEVVAGVAPPLAAVPDLTPAEIARLEAEAAAPIDGTGSGAPSDKPCVACGHHDHHNDPDVDAGEPGCTADGCECLTAVR